MKQYCRYCIHLVTGNGTYCTAKEKELADSTAKSVNRCKMFCYCGIDAFDETKGYKARHIEPTVDEIGKNQMAMEVQT